MDKLHQIMKRGYTVHMQAKGNGRVYAMTFEGSAQKNSTEEMTDDEKVMCFYPVYAFGDTMESVVDQLIEQIDEKEKDVLPIQLALPV